jgi:hypothetical protein
MDSLEEVRTLHTPERKFRNIIKNHLLKLLKLQQIYWRQRYTKKLVKFGDENTKIFHARATERYRRNYIAKIFTHDGRQVSDHATKAALFYQEPEGGWE